MIVPYRDESIGASSESMTAGDDRLSWVMRNRTRRNRVREAGALVAGLANGLEQGEFAASRAAAGALAAVVDDEFRSRCRVAAAERGTLVIHVDEPGLVSAMRLRWSGVLPAMLVGVKAPGGLRRVVFAWGQSGVRVP